MFVLGVVSLLLGLLLLTSESTFVNYFGDFFYVLGTTCLGAGIFTSILKSLQFTEIFQEQLVSVLTDPTQLENFMDLPGRWSWLSRARLTNSLRDSSYEAVNQLEKVYFNNSMEYSFEDFKNTYTINIDASGKANILSKVEARVILNPTCDNPIFIQGVGVKDDGECHIIKLYINDKVEDVKQYIVESNAPDEQTSLQFPLKRFAINDDGQPRSFVKIERWVSVTQNLIEEPYIYGRIGRYTKGMVIKAVVNEGFDLIFKWTGYEYKPGDDTQPDNVEEYRWPVADDHTLLLPGQGYIILIVPSNGTDEG